MKIHKMNHSNHECPGEMSGGKEAHTQPVLWPIPSLQTHLLVRACKKKKVSHSQRKRTLPSGKKVYCRMQKKLSAFEIIKK